MTNEQGDNLIQHIKDNWQIYGAIVLIITTTVTYGLKITNLEARQDKSDSTHIQIENKLAEQQLQYADIQTRLASIETSIKYIERNIK
jgi:hypothetical protein